MKKLILGTMLSLSVAAPAYAMTYFLTNQWTVGANRMCQYGNGTVLNVGIGLCPLSVQG